MTGPAVMGADAALSKSGLVILRGDEMVAWLLAKTDEKASRAERVHQLYVAARRLIREHHPTVCYVEHTGKGVLGWTRNDQRDGVDRARLMSRQDTIEGLAMARGAIMIACAAEGVPCHETPVNVMRGAVVGRTKKGTNGKDAAWKMLTAQGFDLPRTRDGSPQYDVSDALVCARYGQLALARPAAPKGRRPTQRRMMV